MATFTDWLAATFYTSDAEVQLHQDVAAAQQANLDKSLAAGRVDYGTYYATTRDIASAGNQTGDFKAKNSGVLAFLSTFPWWFWPLVIGGLWFYLGMPGLSQLKDKFK
jgi:hypothetical protein